MADPETGEIRLSRAEASAALARLYGPCGSGVTVIWEWDSKLGDLGGVVLVPSPKFEGVPYSEDVIRAAQDRVGATGCLIPRSVSCGAVCTSCDKEFGVGIYKKPDGRGGMRHSNKEDCDG